MFDYGKFTAVTNRALCENGYSEQIEKICALRPDSLILREKDLSEEEYGELAEKINEICRRHGVPLYIHSHFETAEKLGISNIHLPLFMLEKHGGLQGRFENISVSCHSREDALKAEKLGATRIVLGNIFETDCKKGLRGKGLDFLRDVCLSTSLPVWAIGGITPGNIESVINAGAAGGCMMSGFMKL